MGQPLRRAVCRAAVSVRARLVFLIYHPRKSSDIAATAVAISNIRPPYSRLVFEKYVAHTTCIISDVIYKLRIYDSSSKRRPLRRVCAIVYASNELLQVQEELWKLLLKINVGAFARIVDVARK